MIDSRVVAAVRSAHNILCISHVNPDGDAIGSVLGMAWLLRRLGKNAIIAMQDETPVEHSVLPGASDIVTSHSPDFVDRVLHANFDLVICLDASSPDRMGSAYQPDHHGQIPLLVIDHHITNTNFGDINWIDVTCAATCQMLVQLADAFDTGLDGELAECLLTGLVTDTLCFRTSNTDAAILGVAARLMAGGANLSTIAARTVNRQPFSLIKLWSLILPTVRLENHVIWAVARREQFAASRHPTNDIGLSSFLVTADEADISAVFTETETDEGKPAVECSFRAKPGYDVAEVALKLGGGGHPAASGCTITGTLSDVIPDVLSMLHAAHQRHSATAIHRHGETTARAEA